MADTITGRDLRALRAVLDFQTFDDPGPALPWELLEWVRELFHCDSVELDRNDPSERSFLLLQDVSDIRFFVDDDPPDPHYWDLYASAVACNYPQRTGDIAHVTKVSDFLSDREWGSSTMYAEYAGDLRFREMAVYLPDEPGRDLRLILWRGRGRDFGERDRLLLTLLRPHLLAAYRNAERLRRGPVPLTTRQSELMTYVAQGLTNGQVARRMGLSEGTVRTHLTSIYERLGVTSRTAAVTRVTNE